MEIATLSPAATSLLPERRQIQLEEMLREVRLFSRRAEIPEDRVALAEIERELLELQKRWRRDGMLPNGARQEELPFPRRRRRRSDRDHAEVSL